MIPKPRIEVERVRKRRAENKSMEIRLRSLLFFATVVGVYICAITLQPILSRNQESYGNFYSNNIFSSLVPRDFRYLLDSMAGDDGGGGDDGAHGDDGHSSFSLFGAISGLKIVSGTVAVIIIVGAVQFVEFSFHMLHALTHDTPFEQMVQSIEKELMGVGFTAFAFKIMVNTTDFLDTEWFQALEYADILVPIFSFAYCGLGLMLILNSIKISTMWSQAYHLSLTELLDDYFNLSGFVGYCPYGLLLAPINPTIARMEFRIFQSIFCETYKIQKAAFAFNEYVEKVFEKYILTLIKIRLVDWASLCTFVLLNWLRHTINLDYNHCSESLPIEKYKHCEDENSTAMFSIAGAIVLGLTILLAMESRRLEVAIMRQKGIQSVHMYPSYLKYMEESAEAKALDADRLNKDELKASAESVKYSAIQSEMEAAGVEPIAVKPLDTFKSMRIIHGDGGANNKTANKFSASVKQAWKTKKNVVKRRRSVTTLTPDGRVSVRRNSLIGGLGFNFAHLAALRAATANKQNAIAAIDEDEEDSDDDSEDSSSSASEDSSDSGSEVFDVNAQKKRRKKESPASGDSGSSAGAGAGADTETETAAMTPQCATTTTSTALYSAGIVQNRENPSSVGHINAPPRKLPPIGGATHWKAAPYNKRSGIGHVFSRMQKTLDAMRPAPSPSEFQEELELQNEDSKMSWSENNALRKKQLPPLQSAPLQSIRMTGSVLPPLNVKPSVFNRAISSVQDTSLKMNNAASPTTQSAGTTVPAVEAVQVQPNVSQALQQKLAEHGLSPESLLNSKISPARPSMRKQMSEFGAGGDVSSNMGPIIDKTSTPAGANINSEVPKVRSSPPAPRGAKIMISTSRMAMSQRINQDDSNSGDHKNFRFSDISDPFQNKEENSNESTSEIVPSAEERKHKESIAAPHIGSLRYVIPDPATQTPQRPSYPNPAPSNPTPPSMTTYVPLQSRVSGIASGEEEEEAPISAVFFMAWPELYLEGVQSLIMVIGLYWALYFTNFVNAANSAEWKLITFIPAIVCAVLLVYIIKCAVMLGAIHAVDCDAILEVLEQTEGARVLSGLIKEKVISILSAMGPDPQAELVNLFAQIDSDNSGNISRDEFAEYMNSIEIHFDRRRWMQVFRGIDTTFDNKITFEEFYVFMFPEHTLGKAMKERKEARLQQDLKEKSEERIAKLKHYSRGPTRLSFVPTNKNKGSDIESRGSKDA